MSPASDTDRTTGAAPRRRGIFGWLLRGIAGLVLILAVTLLLGRFLPVPSTLMLGRWLIGKQVERQWQPLERISPHLVRAVISSEDQRFCLHRGVDFAALREVLDDEDGPSRGASTIPMQVAKNVYLWPGRSYLRKALEIPLALTLDLAWGKPRVMEIYLNIAEWGDGLFGAEIAAQHYFGKSARDLSAAEAARLAAALPNPLLRSASKASPQARRILSRMGEAGALTGCLKP
jgi:monofunctional glycosyltransferase